MDRKKISISGMKHAEPLVPDLAVDRGSAIPSAVSRDSEIIDSIL